jgi:hypothetical protein
MGPTPQEPPRKPESGLPRWFKAAVIALAISAGGVILLLGGACFLTLTSPGIG